MSFPTRPMAVLLGLGVLAAAAVPAEACWWPCKRQRACPQPCPAPVVSEPPKPEAKPPAKPQAEAASPVPVLTDERFAALAPETVALAGTPNMMGDFIGASTQRTVTVVRTQQVLVSPGSPPSIPPTFKTVTQVVTQQVPVPSATRNFKVADNQNVRPQDRAFVSFNYFDPINRSLNERLNSPVTIPELYRESFGFEKTFCDGNASIGLRVPISTLVTEDVVPGTGLGGSDTEVGDLTLTAKFILGEDEGYLLSAGLAVTLPTGDDTFDPITFETYHSTTFQPFVGYLFKHGRGFLHGFFAVDIPTDDRDATLLFNDIGVGYFLLDNPDGLLSAIVPTFEVHVTNPVNHKNEFDLNDPAGTPDVVVLTGGVTLEFGQSATLALGVGTPVTGPQPFDLEVLIQFNWRFGPGPRAAFPTGP